MSMEKVNLAQKFAMISDPWSPKNVGELNGQVIKIAKLDGEFVWHHHSDAEEFFLVVDGEIKIELRDRTVLLQAGEFFIVPRGVEHRPVAEEEAQVMMFEPLGTLNTGNVRNEHTILEEDKI